MTLMSRSLVTVGLLSMVISSVLCASLPSYTDRSLSAIRQKRGVGFVREKKQFPLMVHIQRKAILLILQQKCQQWRERGITNLPSYCYVFIGNTQGSNVSTSDLRRYYNRYARRVSAEERRQDIRRARASISASS